MVYPFLSKNQKWHYPLGEVPFRADISIIAIFGVYFKTENSSGFPSPVLGNDKTARDYTPHPTEARFSYTTCWKLAWGADIARGARRLRLVVARAREFGGVTRRLYETVPIADNIGGMMVLLLACWIPFTETRTINTFLRTAMELNEKQ